MEYKILYKDGRAKRAEMKTVHGTIQTPVFMNVGTVAAIKGAVSTDDLRTIGTQVELSNTYHLHVRTGDKLIRQFGGLHKFMNWDRPILTDSGGFQVFSLAKLRKIKEEGLVTGHDGFPVYVDSPLAVEATHVFNKNISECFDEEAMDLVNRGINPIAFPGLNLSVSSDDSKAINFDSEPKVIISAAGMCDAGRIRHHLKHNLWRQECTIVFAGYQAVGTLGRSLIEGAEVVKLFGETIDVEAEIVCLDGLSGHADREGLLTWINAFKKKPDRVFMVHGDDLVCTKFANLLRSDYDLVADAPFSGSEFDLAAGAWLKQTVGIPIQKETARQKENKSIFALLVAAGERLMRIIQKNRDCANKDIKKFTAEVNALCEKWDL